MEGWSKKRFARWRPLFKALNLLNYAPEIDRLADAKDKARLKQYRTRLRGALDLYA